MKKLIKLQATRIAALLLLSIAVAASGAAFAAKKDVPKTTKDGLELVKDTKTRIVYMAPGADLSQYTKVAIIDCYVAFKKNWERDYNRDEIGLNQRVTDQDVDRIKKQLAADFKTVFTKEMEAAGHEISTVTGSDVLVLRPAIINLDVTAVDTQRSAGMSRTYDANPGSMTLYLELIDSITNARIAQIEDAEALRTGGTFQVANRVTNSADSKRVLKSWADELAGHLGSVKEPAAAKSASSDD